MAQPTANEQYFLELVNRARANPTGEAAAKGINLNQGLSSGTISASAKQPLTFNAKLMDSALDHSKWMLDTDTFSHTGVGGSNPGARIDAAGYQGQTWGENISIRWGSGTSLTQKTMDSFHDGLFKSAGHRTNILSDNFKEVGIGTAVGEYQGTTGATATQNFGKSGSTPFLTGVAFADKDGDKFYDVGEGLKGVTVKAVSSTGAVFETKAYDAGGYSLQVPAGSYKVTFSGASLGDPVTKSATVNSANVKVDVIDTDGSGTTTPTPAPEPTPAPTPVPDTKPVPVPEPKPEPIPTPDTKPVPAPEVPTTDKVIAGSQRSDFLTGTGKADTLDGKGGHDVLYGRGGDDKLIGGDGKDILLGGSGNDTLIGGKGADLLIGGAGADRFVFTSLEDRGDTIRDFKVGQGDKIVISDMLDKDGLSGKQMIDQGFLKLVDAGSDVKLYVDHDGGGDHFVSMATLSHVASPASLGYDFVV